MPTTFIANSRHYTQVLAHCKDVKHTLWIGTADIKDAYIDSQGDKVPFLKLLAQLIRRGVEVRLIHAKEPGPAFREDFDKYPALYGGLERALCPRVHFKMIIFDSQEVYIGSANLTGAGIGMKGEGTRNFESGILTDDPSLVEQAMDQFDRVWMGHECKRCKRREFCIDPIDNNC
ncbi:MAG: phospholipase D-like domain-containing protein [Bacteroidales bacterium]|nr:phospholipase D-like domain-containing protein [Bacteroidales bacterium]